MSKKHKKNEKGFALALALLLLVIMSIMGTTLVSITSSDIKGNTDKDSGQQAFYAAESGITQAKKYLIKEASKLTLGQNPDGKTQFCKTSFFPNLTSAKTINDHIEKRNLSELIINVSTDESERLSKYSFEYFITYSPDKNGNTSSPKTKTGTSNIYYTIFSCGCNEAKNACNAISNVIVPLEAVVTLVK